MSVEEEISQMAREAVAQAQARAADIEKQYLEAQERAAKLRAQLEFENLAADRLSKFKPQLGANFQCPYCWIERGASMPFRAVPSIGRDDVFKCGYGHTVTLER